MINNLNKCKKKRKKKRVRKETKKKDYEKKKKQKKHEKLPLGRFLKQFNIVILQYKFVTLYVIRVS